MTKFRILQRDVVETFNNYTPSIPLYAYTEYKVQVKVFNLFWYTIKLFDDVDTEYNRRCAEELYDALNERC